MEKKYVKLWSKVAESMTAERIHVVALEKGSEHSVYIIIGDLNEVNIIDYDEEDKQIARHVFVSLQEARESKIALTRLLMDFGYHYRMGSFLGRLPDGAKKFTSYLIRDKEKSNNSQDA